MGIYVKQLHKIHLVIVVSMWELEETIIRVFVRMFGKYSQGYTIDYKFVKDVFRIMENVPNLTRQQQQMLIYKLEEFSRNL